MRARLPPRMIDVAAHQRAMPTPPMPTAQAAVDTPTDPTLSGPPALPGPMGPSMSMGPEVAGRAPAVFRPHNIRRGYA